MSINKIILSFPVIVLSFVRLCCGKCYTYVHSIAALCFYMLCIIIGAACSLLGYFNCFTICCLFAHLLYRCLFVFFRPFKLIVVSAMPRVSRSNPSMCTASYFLTYVLYYLFRCINSYLCLSPLPPVFVLLGSGINRTR